jgi:hypothetical protein
VLDTTVCKETNIINKTWALLQTTGGKDELNMVFMWKSYRASQHGTQNIKPHNRTTQKTIKMSNTDPSKNQSWTHMLKKGKQFLLLIRHPPCYSYIQSISVKVLAVIEERKNLRKKLKIHCHLRYGYFINGQPDCDDDRIIFVAMTST